MKEKENKNYKKELILLILILAIVGNGFLYKKKATGNPKKSAFVYKKNKSVNKFSIRYINTLIIETEKL